VESPPPVSVTSYRYQLPLPVTAAGIDAGVDALGSACAVRLEANVLMFNVASFRAF